MAFSDLFVSLQSINPFGTQPPPPTIDPPTVRDVLATKAILLGHSLPLELVDTIIDYAEYWPHTSAPTIQETTTIGDHLYKDRFVTRTLPLGYLPNTSSTDYNLVPARVRKNVATPHLLPRSPSENSKAATAALLAAWAASSRPRDAHPCRKIVFRFRSHDQGWGGDPNDRGSYNGSYTWFDVGRERAKAVITNKSQERSVELLRHGDVKRGEILKVELAKTLAWDLDSVDPLPKLVEVTGRDGIRMPRVVELDHPFLPHNKILQKNRTATSEEMEYTIVWRWDDGIIPGSTAAQSLIDIGRGEATGNGEFVRSLEVGDVVTLWARARFNGWYNMVKDVRVDMYWAV